MYEILFGAKKHLEINGELWIVINKDQGAKSVVRDLEKEYAKSLMIGANPFRTYVEGWYNTKFQDVIYNDKNQTIKRNICSVLAGYAWDESNPYVSRSDEALNVLWEYCR